MPTADNALIYANLRAFFDEDSSRAFRFRPFVHHAAGGAAAAGRFAGRERFAALRFATLAAVSRFASVARPPIASQFPRPACC